MRLYSVASEANLVGELCPGCGSLLEPVGELAEIVGFQSIKYPDGAAEGSALSRHRRLAARVNDLFARSEAVLSQKRFEAGRWDDDGGSVSPEVVAEAIALSTPRDNP